MSDVQSIMGYFGVPGIGFWIQIPLVWVFGTGDVLVRLLHDEGP